jgi:hypothetical protein
MFLVGASGLASAANSHAAIVLHPGDIPCTFEPGDVPGVNVFFPAKCTVIIRSNGGQTVVAHGQLPQGFSLSHTFVGTLPCFGFTGRVTATVSGRVNATCHLK